MTYSEDSYEKIELIHLTQCVFFLTEVKNPDLHSFFTSQILPTGLAAGSRV